MVTLRHFSLALVAVCLSACVSTTAPASRGVIPAAGELTAATGLGENPVARGLAAGTSQSSGPAPASYDIEAIRIAVPRSLTVSEANTFKPRADIVWRGEALGDRHAQVSAIFQEAMTAGTADAQQGQKVDLDIEVTRFHALTEKTRYTFGGMHEMRFVLTLRDSATGQVLDGPREIVADIKASGGSAAIAEEQAGLTQRVVTVARLAQVIGRELAAPAAVPQVVARQASSPAQLTD